MRARGHFPNEAAALKCVYLAVMSLDPTGQGRRRWTMRWKPALITIAVGAPLHLDRSGRAAAVDDAYVRACAAQTEATVQNLLDDMTNARQAQHVGPAQRGDDRRSDC